MPSSVGLYLIPSLLGFSVTNIKEAIEQETETSLVGEETLSLKAPSCMEWRWKIGFFGLRTKSIRRMAADNSARPRKMKVKMMQQCLLLGELNPWGLEPLGSSASAFSNWFVSCVSISNVVEEFFPVGF